MKKPAQRTPVPRKSPKVETPKKTYDRKRAKRELREALKNVDNKA